MATRTERKIKTGVREGSDPVKAIAALSAARNLYRTRAYVGKTPGRFLNSLADPSWVRPIKNAVDEPDVVEQVLALAGPQNSEEAEEAVRREAESETDRLARYADVNPE